MAAANKDDSSFETRGKLVGLPKQSQNIGMNFQVLWKKALGDQAALINCATIR